ncbi:hypothetical protein [Phascolarctobacterium sp.]|nr:hypothetical protein [Phascolarctobacterium sp.]
MLNQMKKYTSIKDEFWDYADMLTPYGVNVRYLGEWHITEQQTVKA